MESNAAQLRKILNPESVVVGASGDTGKFGGRAMRFLLKHGYAGRIVPVNPGAPDPIDLALLAVPARRSPARASRPSQPSASPSSRAGKPVSE